MNGRAAGPRDPSVSQMYLCVRACRTLEGERRQKGSDQNTAAAVLGECNWEALPFISLFSAVQVCVRTALPKLSIKSRASPGGKVFTPDTWDAKSGRLQVQSLPRPQSEGKARLGYLSFVN